jgi:hypothetical protein
LTARHGLEIEANLIRQVAHDLVGARHVLDQLDLDVETLEQRLRVT